MQRMQSELIMMKSNLHPLATGDFASGPTIQRNPYPYDSSGTRQSAQTHMGGVGGGGDPSTMFEAQHQPQQNQQLIPPHQQQLISTAHQPVTWKLSLSPSGLRIDTNIASVADLYRILLNGISQLNISGDSATSLFSMDSLRGDHGGGKRNNNSSSNEDFDDTAKDKNGSSSKSTRASRAWGRYAKYRSFGNGNGNGSGASQGIGAFNGADNALVSTTSSLGNNRTTTTATIAPSPSSSSTASSPGRLWEVNETEARMILQEKLPDDTMDQETLNNLVTNTYHSCFLAYQIVDHKTFVQHYGGNKNQSGLDPLLFNSVNSWLSKHGCIYHGRCPEKDPSTMGEVYFKNARQLLKKCFDISSPNTIHALINLYMYQLSCERSNLAYLYIGLAIRMAQDLKFHKKEFMPADPVLKEAHKRLWWTAYWLDLCAALESNRPTMVDDKDCDLEYPVKLDCEDDETGYRIGFAVHSIKLMKVRKDITKHLPSEQSGQSLLSAISRLENALTGWLQELPIDVRLESDEPFTTTGSFRDEACLILNIQYQTTWIMLHKFFLPKKDQTSTPVALLSLNICTKAANFITKMLDLYRCHLPWCQFSYALDGVIASVTIHQVNALSTEEEVAHLAQRNLIVTADILRQSPLIYMEKVNEIVDSIEGFLRKNKLSTNLQDLPMVNEDSINQQCLSSVFHPADFEQQTDVSSTPNNSNNYLSSSVPSSSTSSVYIPQSHNVGAGTTMATFGTPPSSSSMMASSTSSVGNLQQQNYSPIALSTSSFTPSMNSQYQRTPNMSTFTPVAATATTTIPSQSQPTPSMNVPQPSLSTNNGMFGNDMFSSHHPMMTFGTSPLASSTPNSLNGTTAHKTDMDQFLFDTDMQFMNSPLHNQGLQHQGNMFNQLGTSPVPMDTTTATIMNNNSSTTTTTTTTTTPAQVFDTNNSFGLYQNNPLYHAAQQQQQNLTPSAAHAPPTTDLFSAMQTAGSLHDILYGDTLAQQEAALAASGTAGNNTTTTPSFNTTMTTSTMTTNNNTTTTNTTVADTRFNFGETPHGFMDDAALTTMFTAMVDDMNTGKKRIHREWDDANQ
ncbi:fungal-specific transcription factor domain-domain-containing protein [Absidia repens]|uniref:Fungal-specific transcription factor domain-domain-containing protein n=1 Tax=Absidia repens TaxID=90262 RepID=A0A1X2IQD8_9FUNG|nr:fungal-specific transcription factor domain-domain-containing protein [Absidia repens]